MEPLAVGVGKIASTVCSYRGVSPYDRERQEIRRNTLSKTPSKNTRSYREIVGCWDWEIVATEEVE